MADNPVRPCFGCSTFDSDPRHEIALANGGSADPFHVDCCAEKRGCAVCAALVASKSADVHLRDHLRSLPPTQVEHPHNDDGSDPYDLTTAIVTGA